MRVTTIFLIFAGYAPWCYTAPAQEDDVPRQSAVYEWPADLPVKREMAGNKVVLQAPAKLKSVKKIPHWPVHL